MGCLYLITSPSGKQYIGITMQTLTARWRAHKAAAKNNAEGYLQNAIRKYGAEAMKRQILVVADDHDYLKALEQRAIVAFGTKAPRGYNMTDGGDGVLGAVITEAGRVRRSEAQRKSFSDPHRRSVHLASQQCTELRAKRSAIQKERVADPIYREHLSKKLKAAFATPEARKKLADRPKGPRLLDGLSKSQRYRLKDLDSYRERKREFAKTDAQREKRTEYMRGYRDRNRATTNETARLSHQKARQKIST